MPLSEALIEQAVEDGILDLEEHDGLLQRIGTWTRLAGISEEDLVLRISHHCSKREVDWFRSWGKWIEDGMYGLMYVGTFAPKGESDVGLRMRSLTAGFLRYYVDARIRSCEKALKEDCTILMIPDFGAEPSEYIRQRVGPLILARASEGKPTLVHVADLGLLEQWWGKAVADLLEDSYAKVIFE